MQNDSDVGALQRLPPREVFAHEAHDFTAWLEENIGVLSDVLGITLTPVEREKSAVDFSADLLAEDEPVHATGIGQQPARMTVPSALPQ